MTLQNLITIIGNAIERQEGGRDAAGNIVPNTRAARNNNFGNIWDGLCPGKVQRIWPRYPIDSAGFVVFPNYATGRGAMDRQISLKISRKETLRILIEQWDSSDTKPVQEIYVEHVAEWTGLPTDQVLLELVTE